MGAFVCLTTKVPAHASPIMLAISLNLDKSLITAVIVIKIINHATKFLPPFLRFIRCWDAKYGREIYRITVGLGGSGSGPELCVWSLLSLRYSADASFISLVYGCMWFMGVCFILFVAKALSYIADIE